MAKYGRRATGKRLYLDCRPEMIRFGKNLQVLRLRREWSLRQTIDILNMNSVGTSLGILAGVERGERMITIGTALRLARFYGVSLSDLLGTDLTLDSDKGLNQSPRKANKKSGLKSW